MHGAGRVNISHNKVYQLIFTCSKSIMETQEKVVKWVQSGQ